MNDLILRQKVIFFSQKALVGNITKNMTSISISWTADSYHIRLFVNTLPTENDFETLSEITTEICADLPFIINCKEEIFMWDENNYELLDETIFLIKNI